MWAGNLGVDRSEKADEFLMAMALHVSADDGAVEKAEGGAVAFVLHVPSRPFFIGRPGWVRSSAWI